MVLSGLPAGVGLGVQAQGNFN